MDIVQQWPPVTRVLLVTTVALSILIYGQVISPMPWIFESRRLVQFPPELWRLFTSFCITNPGLSIIFDGYFLYTYSSGLERNSPRFTEHGSYFVYIAFIMTFISLFAGYLQGGVLLLQPMILALAYTFSQDNPNTNVTIFVITFAAKYLPYALLLMSLVMAGPGAAKLQITGLLAAHLYDFLTRIWPTFGGGSNWLQTPLFVKRWFMPAGTQTQTRGYGTAFNARQDVPPSHNWSNQRGPGRRLGAE